MIAAALTVLMPRFAGPGHDILQMKLSGE